MEETNFKLSFAWKHIIPNNFKQSNAAMINGMIAGGRMGEYYVFSSYALMYFDDDDKNNLHPIVELQDKFNRTKTNCMVYDMPINEANRGYYDKMFLYHSNGTSIGNYGLVLYNTETKRCVHISFIDDAMDSLLQTMARLVNTIRDYPIYEIYRRKSKNETVAEIEVERVISEINNCKYQPTEELDDSVDCA